MLRVVSLGSVVSDPRFYREQKNGVTLYPLGYTIERGVFVAADATGPNDLTRVLLPGEDGADRHVADVYFTASIKQGSDGGPLFEVIRSDAPEVVHSGDDPFTPWRKAFEAAEEDFPDRVEEILSEKRDARGSLVVRGQKWYGLSFDSILALLRKPSGSQDVKSSACSSQKGTKRSRETSVSVSANAATPTTTTARAKRGSQVKNSVESSQQSTIQTDASAHATKRRMSTKNTTTSNDRSKKTSKANNKKNDDDDDVPLSVLASRKMNKIEEACPACGLKSPFCPVTGKPHGVGEQKKQKGTSAATGREDTLGKSRRTSKSADGTSLGAVEKAEKKPRRKRIREVDTNDGEDASSAKIPSEESVNKAKTRQKRAKKGESDQGKGKDDQPEELTLNNKKRKASSDPDDVPLVLRLARNIANKLEAENTSAAAPSPKLTPPLWRPPLAAPESNKALHVLQRLIRGEGVIHVPFASLLHLPLVPAAKARGPKKKNDENGTSAENIGAEGTDNNDNTTSTSAGASTTAGKAEKSNKATEGKYKHPLEITDVAISVAGKRYVKFMQMYVSERTKMDLLKKSDIIPTVPRTRLAINKQLNKDDTSAPVSTAADDDNKIKPELQNS